MGFIDYDERSDVLHINFHDPPLEEDRTNRRGDFTFRYSSRGLRAGVTIVNFVRYAGLIRSLVELPPAELKALEKVIS